MSPETAPLQFPTTFATAPGKLTETYLHIVPDTSFLTVSHPQVPIAAFADVQQPPVLPLSSPDVVPNPTKLPSRDHKSNECNGLGPRLRRLIEDMRAPSGGASTSGSKGMMMRLCATGA